MKTPSRKRNLVQKLAIFFCLVLPLSASTALLVTVVDKRSGAPLTGLQAADFTVRTGSVERRVEACQYLQEPLDVVLLIDASVVGEPAASLAPQLIRQLAQKEQMAIIAYDGSADLIQDFTSSLELLSKALSQIKFGNSPRMLDALYAAISEAFRPATFRRVLILLTSGIEGPSSVTEQEVIRAARRNRVSIYAIHVAGSSRAMLQRIAQATGGAALSLRDLGRNTPNPAARVFEVARGYYRLEIHGNLPLAEDLSVQLRRPDRDKYLVSVLPLD